MTAAAAVLLIAAKLNVPPGLGMRMTLCGNDAR